MSELQTMSLIPSHVLATVHLSVLVGSLQNSNNTVSALSILTVGVDSTFSLSTSTMATDGGQLALSVEKRSRCVEALLFD